MGRSAANKGPFARRSSNAALRPGQARTLHRSGRPPRPGEAAPSRGCSRRNYQSGQARAFEFAAPDQGLRKADRLLRSVWRSGRGSVPIARSAGEEPVVAPRSEEMGGFVLLRRIYNPPGSRACRPRLACVHNDSDELARPCCGIPALATSNTGGSHYFAPLNGEKKLGARRFTGACHYFTQSVSTSGPSSGILLSRIHICTAFIISLLRRMAVGKGVPLRTFSSKKYSPPSF